MNKAAGIGIIIAVIIGIIVVSAAISMESIEDNELGLDDVLEVKVVEEPEEVVEEQGRDLSVEFSETIGLKSP